MRQNRRGIVFILYLALSITMALSIAGCANRDKTETSSEANLEGAIPSEGGEIGEGSKQFDFTVVDKEGKETAFEVHTDKEYVGEALEELGLIAGEDSEYGLYVKTVNGITADFDEDGVYWAFYVNEEYALTGVDTTTITEGDSYSFRIE